MARPIKNRIVQSIPGCEGFIPLGYDPAREYPQVTMTVDEYEAIRLIDLTGATQEDCAKSMGISRPTVTNIYESARHKLADALLNEKILLIEGGNYDISHQHCKIAKLNPSAENAAIAIACSGEDIFPHFGRCRSFKVYHLSGGAVQSSEVLRFGHDGHGALIDLLRQHNVRIVICGGIGAGAQSLLKEAGITFYAGITGTADAAVNALLAGKLRYSDHVFCASSEGNCPSPKR